MKISMKVLTCLAFLFGATLVWAQAVEPEIESEIESEIEPEIEPEIEQGIDEEAVNEPELDAEVPVDETSVEELVVEESVEELLEPEDEFAGDEAPEGLADAEPAPEDVIPAVADEPIEPRTFSIQAHPIFIPDQAISVYLPLVDYLNETSPHTFELKIPRDFHRFWLDIRRGGQPDLVLEDAHLISMRINRQGYTPLVKASEPGTFSLLTSGMNIDAGLSDFVGRPVSSMPAPSLGYLILSSWYDNPMQQPIIQSNASSWLDAVEIVFSMEAEAAIVPHNLVARYVNMEVVRTSEPFPHAVIAAGPDVPASVQRELTAALIVLHEDGEHFGALHELDIDRFVPATTEDFEGLDRWLDQIFIAM